MINLFQTNTDDFQYILDSLGKDVVINNQPIKAVICNQTLNTEYDDNKISTTQLIKRGDIVDFHGKWLIISEINGQKNGKYKGIMRKCNGSISIKVGENKVLKGYDSMGRPIYETIPIYTNVECIVETKVLGLDANGAINLPQGKINIIIQDNADTQKVALSNTFTVAGGTWKVIGIDLTKVGLRILNCEKTV